MSHRASGSRVRCLVVWLLVTAVGALTVGWTAADLRPDGLATAPLERLLVWVSAVALTGCVAWVWVVTGVVVAQALAGERHDRVPGVPGWARTAVLLACGIALAGPGGAAQADAGSDRETAQARAEHAMALDGLPYPDRAVGSVAPPARPSAAVARVHVVQPGDTLWDLAADDLGGRASSAEVTAYWHRIHALNRALIGPDPDLIRPGQQLRMPTPQHR